jgi:hypothetical protein
MAVLHALDQPRVGQTPAVGPRPVGLDPGLVEEDEAVRVDAGLLEGVELGALGDDGRPVAFGGLERFF